MPGKGRGKGKTWRKNLGEKRERNWTDLETETLCTVLADGEFQFALTLETMALKKQKKTKKSSLTFKNN